MELKTFIEQDALDYCSINNIDSDNIMVLNLSGAKSFFNAEEVIIEHSYGLVLNLEIGIVSVSEPIDPELTYNYTMLVVESDNKKKEIAIGSLDVLSEENLAELREFYGYEPKDEDSDMEEESDDYKQLSIYGYGLEELGFTIGEMYVVGLGRLGNTTEIGNKNVLRLSGEIIRVEKPYDREKAILAVKEIVKNCKEIAEYYKVYKKVFI